MSLSILALAAALQAAPPPIVAPPPFVPAGPPAPPSPPPPPRLMEPVRARANLASYISDADYPFEALMNDEEGAVGFRLLIGPDGRVANCVVTRSSGVPSLDDATCNIMRRRPRFIPARTQDGAPVADVMHAQIRWVMADEETPQAEAGTDAPPPIVQRTRPVSPLAGLVRDSDYPAAAARELRQGTAHLILSVGPGGRVTGCEIRTTSSSPDLDEAACRILRDRARFMPARDSAGTAVADRYWSHVAWRLPVPRRD